MSCKLWLIVPAAGLALALSPDTVLRLIRAIVLKPAEESPLSALRLAEPHDVGIEDIFR